jgi:hypothetical protein
MVGTNFLANAGNGTRLILDPVGALDFSSTRVFAFPVQTQGASQRDCRLGYFARYARLPEWLAWESFSEANGCSSFEEMHSRVEQIRRRFRYVQPEGIPQIGCIIVVNVSFFSESEWIPQPADWPVRNLRPTRCDLETGEGARVWQECLHRSASYRVFGNA